MNEVFDYCVRSAGDLAGVYEYDGETGYFYLYRTNEGSREVVSALHVLSGESDLRQDDLMIRWDRSETKVGLFIRDSLWAVFDSSGNKFGGNYTLGARPRIPKEAAIGF